jgi:hypothetical protein
METKSVNVYDYLSFVDSSVANIQAAMNRSKLTGLNKTKVLKQKLLNDGYHYPFGDKQVCYCDATGKADNDIIIAFGIDKRDGSILTTEVDSSFFEVL